MGGHTGLQCGQKLPILQRKVDLLVHTPNLGKHFIPKGNNPVVRRIDLVIKALDFRLQRFDIGLYASQLNFYIADARCDGFLKNFLDCFDGRGHVFSFEVILCGIADYFNNSANKGGDLWGERKCGRRRTSGPGPPGSGAGSDRQREGPEIDAILPHFGGQDHPRGFSGDLGVQQVGGDCPTPERGQKPVRERTPDGPRETVGETGETNRIMMRFVSGHKLRPQRGGTGFSEDVFYGREDIRRGRTLQKRLGQ